MKPITCFTKSPGRFLGIIAVITVVLFVSFAGMTLAAAGGRPAGKLVNVADTRGMASGFSLWVAGVYNTNLWLFGLLVVVTMGVMGSVFGLIFDKVFALLGIQLGRLEHRE